MEKNNRTKTNWAKAVLILIIIANALDLIITKRILIGEANPLYIMTGSFTVIVIGKLVFTGFILLMYRNLMSSKIGDRNRYLISAIMIYALIALSIAVVANSSVPDEHIEKVTKEINILKEKSEQGDEASTINLEKIEKRKIRDYILFSFFIMIFPMIFGFVSFCLWENSLGWVKNSNEKKARI